MSNIEQPLSKEEMIEAIVDEVRYWDLETLIGWVQDVMKQDLQNLTYEQVHEEYTFYFDEE